ncbi:MAG: DUF1244 domain-containing protein [Sphingomonadales bacterium]|nr:MAG: DUF1244 domain-containing protein [Sphingomonadales bacterium]
MTEEQRQHLESMAFRRLLEHLRHRTDVQNIDLMGHGGFCRNCLADWLMEAAAETGASLDKAGAREWVYGMSYDDYRAQFQTPASQEQLDRMAASVVQNRK